MQVDPIKPTLKAPGSKRLKPNYDKLLTILLQFCFNFVFKFKLRRYDTGAEMRYYNDVWELTLETMVWKVRVGVGPAAHRLPRRLTRFNLSVGVTCHPQLLEIEGLFTQGWRPGRTFGESVGGMLEIQNTQF